MSNDIFDFDQVEHTYSSDTSTRFGVTCEGVASSQMLNLVK